MRGLPQGQASNRRTVRDSGLALVLAIAVIFTGLSSAHTPRLAEVTEANWTRTVHSSGAVSAGVLNPVRNLQCTSGVAQNPRLSWQAPTSGPQPTGYTVLVYSIPGNNLLRTIDLGAGTNSYTLGDTVLDLGPSYSIHVQARLEGNWRSRSWVAEARRFSALGIPLNSSCTRESAPRSS